MHSKNILTVPLKATGSAGLHWIMAPLKCEPLTGRMQWQASSNTASTRIVLIGAGPLILAAH